MLEFAVFALFIFVAIGYAQLAGKIRYLEKRLREFELNSLSYFGAEQGKERTGDSAPAPNAQQASLRPRTVTVIEPVTPIAPSATPSPEPAVATATAKAAIPPTRPRIAAYSEPASSRTDSPASAPKTPLETSDSILAKPQPALKGVNFEELFGRRLPIWAGGIVLAIAGVLIVRYAIDIGLFGRIFTPEVQVSSGILFGLGLIGAGEWAHRKQDKVNDPRVPQALSGAGISSLYAAIYVAADVYAFLPTALALLLTLGITAGAMALSIRHGIASAVLGLAGGLAAPALTLGWSANVPMMSVYLAITITGMVWVSRMQRWAWLGLAAMTGGAMWSALLILVGQWDGAVSLIALGGFILLLAFILPAISHEDAGAKDWMQAAPVRAISGVVGAVQLALIVATGGYSMLSWGLYAILAVAAQAITLPPLAKWFTAHAHQLSILPRVSAALAILLLFLWPRPETGQLVLIASVMALIHFPAMVYRLWWRVGAGDGEAWDLSAAALSIAVIYAGHFAQHSNAPLQPGTAIALCAGAALLLLGAGLGWTRAERHQDRRFIILISVAAGLAMLAVLSGLPAWQAPIGFAAISAAWFGLGRYAKEARLDSLTVIAMGLSLSMLIAAQPAPITSELSALIGFAPDTINFMSIARWGAVMALAILFVWQARVGQWQRSVVTGIAAFLGYGVIANLLPATILPLATAGLVALLATASVRVKPLTRAPLPLMPAVLALAGIVLAWTLAPASVWLIHALPSLYGEPMIVDSPLLTTTELARRLIGPTMLLAYALRLVQGALPQKGRMAGYVMLGIISGIAAHSLYRIGFAKLAGDDFIATGLMQRFGWEMILASAGFALYHWGKGEAQRTAAPVMLGTALLHLVYYSLFLHNPLWTAQSVGPWPLVNAIAPLFAALPFGLIWLVRMRKDISHHIAPAMQYIIMAMIALATWASVRHLFHGAVLSEGGQGDAEGVVLTLAILALAVGFLLWGIRTRLREWRIASLALMLLGVFMVFGFVFGALEGLAQIISFVALGFTLIGIGWLYARHLRREETAPASPAAVASP